MFIEFDREKLTELLIRSRKFKTDRIAILLAQVKLFRHVNYEALMELSINIREKTYKKGEMIFDESYFPLNSFFIVKTGSVNLHRAIQVERVNYMPTMVHMYEKRAELRLREHCLGHVKPL